MGLKENVASTSARVLTWCTLATAFGFMVVLCVPAIFPIVAAESGLRLGDVSFFGAVTFGAAMLSALTAGGLVQRYGPLVVFEIATLTGAVGLLLVAIGPVELLFVSASLTGLGYGPMNALTATLLYAHTEPRRRGTYFSIKQSGVALGGALAGASMPFLASAIGWRSALVTIAGAAALVAFSGRWLHLQMGGDPAARLGVRAVLSQLADALRIPFLKRLAFMALAFNSLQAGTTTVLVTYLTDDVRVSLVVAGGLLSINQAAGLLGRLGWGVVADWSRRPVLVLTLLGMGMALFSIAMIAFDSTSSMFLLTGAVLLLGLTSSGWNGVFLAEVARIAGAGRVSSATGCCSAFALAGGAVGPGIFGIGFVLTQSNVAGFVLTAVLVLATTWLALVPHLQTRVNP